MLYLFLRKRFAPGIASLSLLTPLFAKNSRLGYFFNANNPQGGSYSPKAL